MTAGVGMRRSTGGICWLVALILGAAGYWAWSRHPVVFDDAYITYRYADNLVSGYGPIYNHGERVEGYTNFAWMLLSAAGIWAGQDPLQVTRVAGLSSHVLMLALIGWLAALWLIRAGWSRLLLLPVLALLVLPNGFAAMAGSGLETSFVACLLVLCAALIYAGDFSRPRARIALGVLLALSVLTRLDAMLSVGAACVALLVGERRRGVGTTAAFRTVAISVGPVLLLVAAWTLWRRAYYGDVLPNTFYAKAADRAHLDAGWIYVVAFVNTYPQVLPLAVMAIAALASPDAGLRRMALFACITLAAEVVYVIKIGGDFMEFRFMWQLYGLLVLCAVGGVATIAARSLAAGLAVALCMLVMIGRPMQPEPRYTIQSLDEMDGFVTLGRQVGRKLKEVLPKDTVISTTLAGTLAYFSKLTVIDQWGLNDHYIAHMPFVHFIRGHVKYAPLPYLYSRGVNLYIEHPILCSCSSLCVESRPDVFVRMSKGRCLRAWYMTQTPKLTDYFCAHPEWFALSRVTCPHTTKPKAKSKPKPAAALQPIPPVIPPPPPALVLPPLPPTHTGTPSAVPAHAPAPTARQ
jgi:arabinofuranosyltransferase